MMRSKYLTVVIMLLTIARFLGEQMKWWTVETEVITLGKEIYSPRAIELV
jgi:hypothetical protein